MRGASAICAAPRSEAGLGAPNGYSLRVYDGSAAPPAKSGTCAGLVLLYSPSFHLIEPAYPFHRESLMIGRDPTSDIVLPMGSISRKHARVDFEKGTWVLSDPGSRNGIVVSGHDAPVRRVVLEDKERVRIGDAIFQFVAHGAERYVDHRIDGIVLDETADEHAARQGRSIVGGQQIQRLVGLASHVATTGLSVVLLGESGVGKELFARHIHDVSRRRGAFQAVNCAAIPAGLVESELFGCKRGAFSGADSDKAGHVRSAHGGTLFLDEIGDMPLEAQAKLLRVLQFKEVTPLGATTPEPVDVRVVCATHRDLKARSQDGRFRPDLLGRLNEYLLQIPPLRNRKEDVYMLCRTVLAKARRADLRLSFALMEALLDYAFPGNVRELEAAVRVSAALATDKVLTTEHLPEEMRSGKTSVAAAPTEAKTSGLQRSTPRGKKAALPPTVPAEAVLRASLGKHAGNISAVARDLRSARVSVHRWVKLLGIRLEDYR